MMPTRPTIGPYLAERLIGLGADSAVWRASGPRGAVALKVARHEGARARLATEARTLGVASHPHLVRLEHSGEGWLATELVDGEPVARWSQGKSAQAILAVFLEVASALQHLHAHGFVHGDLKPAHVLVDSWGHAKLVDLATPVSRAEAHGTPGFMAPEAARPGGLGPAADIYGLGATLHASLTGHAPFGAMEAAAAVHLPMVSAPIPPSAYRADVPDKIDRVIQAMLLRDPARRPGLDEVIEALSRSWKLPCRRPVVGMLRARRALHQAVARAADGHPTAVMIHGPLGSGRRTLVDEAVRLARLLGMEVVPRFSPKDFAQARLQGARPVAAARASSQEAWEAAQQLTGSPEPALLLLHGPVPSISLADVSVVHITPDALSLDDAQLIGAWLGVRQPTRVEQAWRATHGHAGSLWIALEPAARAHTEDRVPFTLPTEVGAIIAALRGHRDVMTLDEIARATDMSLAAVADVCALVQPTGRIVAEADGWRLRLVDTETS